MAKKYFGTDGIRGTVNQVDILMVDKVFKFGSGCRNLFYRIKKKSKQVPLLLRKIPGYLAIHFRAST